MGRYHSFRKRTRAVLCGGISKRIMAILAILVAVSRHDHCDRVRLHSARAFQPTSSRISKMKPKPTGNNGRNDAKVVMLEPSSTTTSNTFLPMALGKKNNEDEETNVSPIFWKDIAKKPGNLIALPFIALLGLDLLLNLIFITKRSIEYFIFGQVPSTEPWW